MKSRILLGSALDILRGPLKNKSTSLDYKIIRNYFPYLLVVSFEISTGKSNSNVKSGSKSFWTQDSRASTKTRGPLDPPTW